MSSKYLTILPAMAAALLLAACSQDALTGNILSDGQYPLVIGSVSITAEVSDDPLTRVSEGTDGSYSQWDGNDVINVRIGTGTPGTYSIDSNGSVTAVTPAYWKSNANGQAITAWYASPETDGTVDLSDQSAGLAYVLLDRITANFNTSASLTFTHQLAKVRVVTNGTYDLTDATISVTAPTSCTVSQGSVTATGDEGLIKMYKTSYDGIGTCWEANVPGGTTIYRFTISDSNNTVVCATADILTTAGQISTATLTVNTLE